MKHILANTLVLGGFFFGSLLPNLTAQTFFQIFLESDNVLKADGTTTVTPGNPNGVTLFYSNTSESFASLTTTFSGYRDLLENDVAQGVAEIKNFLNSYSWTAFFPSGIAGIDWDSGLSGIPVPAGNRPLVLALDSDIEGFGFGSQIGLLTAPTGVPGIGNIAYAFDAGSNSLDGFLLGSEGSLVMHEVVPEPEAVAFLAAALTLGVVVWRRRRLLTQ